MQFNDKDLTLLAVGGAFALLVFFIAHSESGGSMQPRYEDNPNLGKVVDHLDTGDHYFNGSYSVPGQGVKFTAHRYPVTSGPNITALIHHGMDAMRQPAPQDDDWRVGAPAELAWLPRGLSRVLLARFTTGA